MILKLRSFLLSALLVVAITADDSDWAVCTLEGLLSLSKNAVNLIEPPFISMQHVCLICSHNVFF